LSCSDINSQAALTSSDIASVQAVIVLLSSKLENFARVLACASSLLFVPGTSPQSSDADCCTSARFAIGTFVALSKAKSNGGFVVTEPDTVAGSDVAGTLLIVVRAVVAVAIAKTSMAITISITRLGSGSAAIIEKVEEVGKCNGPGRKLVTRKSACPTRLVVEAERITLT
jgi:hypothetical protein